MTEELFVGLEKGTGEPVHIPVFHMAVTGQTQLSGKTTIIKTLAQQAVEKHGYRVLVFDTKENMEDFKDFGEPVPICMKDTTDSLVLINLAESIFGRRITQYYSVLTWMTQDAETLQDVIDRANKKIDELKESWFRGACITLSDLLTRLQKQLTQVETVDTLQLPHRINRMVLNYFDRESQQVYVKYALEDALRRYKHKLIIILDEAFKFIPQRYGSVCKKAIQDVITQGAGTGLYIWITTQFLAPTDKDPLKACAVRLLGTQDHVTEATHTLDLIPKARQRGFDKDTIMTLPLGHFVTITKSYAKLVYAVPRGVPLKEAEKVALGALSPEHVRDHYLKNRHEDKEAEETGRLKTLISRLEKNIRERETETARRLDQLTHRVEELEKLRGEIHEIKKLLQQLTETTEQDKKRREPPTLGAAAQTRKPPPPAQTPATDWLSEAMPLILERVDRRVHQLVNGLSAVRVVKVDAAEAIRERLKSRTVADIAQRIQALTETLDGKPALAAQILFHRQRMRVSELNQTLYRTKKAGGDFYNNIVNPLVNALLVKKGEKRSGMLIWSLKENLKRELEGLASEEELEQIHNYLLSLLITQKKEDE